MREKDYKAYVESISPKSNLLLDCVKAFAVGGLICTLGEAICSLLRLLSISRDDSTVWTSVILIFIGATLTGIGIYDKIGKFAGAGSIVPITGFANGITSPAMEYKPEGYVLGIGAKLFIIAGPVIVYGVCASMLGGLIYYILSVVG